MSYPSLHQPLRVCVIDDEPLAYQGLCQIINQQSSVTVVGEHAIGQHAVDQVRQWRPDLLFLDIHMPQVDGFGLLSALPTNGQPLVVFVTAHEQHALEAFRIQALGYVLKPFDDEQIFQALERASRQLRAQWALESLSADYASHLTTKTKRGQQLIPVEQIDLIRSYDYYALVHVGFQKYLVRQSMNELEQRLDPRYFVRIHRSAIVATRQIATILGQTLITVTNQQLPISKAGSTKLRYFMQRLAQ
ncbi:LytR/AlgR family response regulator transcription factor [Spirosoma soli]|uniref:LytR/AlgR family response regulator transcription factor n=1 Tax=Spirosoma soli TaxID=1770529 RepID=A0ABW5LXD6_9BACT